MKKICVVTSTRAEYGLLKNLLIRIDEEIEFELCLIVTGTHLSHEFGMTVNDIINDGFKIAEKIDILMNSDSPSSISKTMGIASISFSDALEKHKPDIMVVLGDRYELLPICSCAMNARIPIAHISGGETTEGAIDECIRHCITKMSYLHFPACETYRRRIIQLGEAPDRVFNFGDVGVELIRKMDFIDKKTLKNELLLNLDKPYGCVTFHSTTLEVQTAAIQVKELLEAISRFPNMNFVFTKANSDSSGRIINDYIDHYVRNNSHAVSFISLGSKRYLSVVKYASVVIGNSSSGIVEAPALGVPSVNIGDRQKGRLQASSIINCEPKADEIVNAIQHSLTSSFIRKARNTVNPYGSGNTSYEIVEVIKDFLCNSRINLKKKFYDIDFIV